MGLQFPFSKTYELYWININNCATLKDLLTEIKQKEGGRGAVRKLADGTAQREAHH